MNKREFLADLAEKIDCLPQEDINHWIDYYSEMIDDRIEDGMSEEQAVYAMGNVYDIATQIMIDTPIRTLVKTKAESARRLQSWEIVLLAVGAVVWVPLLIAAIAVVFSMYVTMWALLISAYAVAVSFCVCGIASMAACFFVIGGTSEVIAAVGIGLILTGIGVIMILGLRYAAHGIVFISKTIWRGIKKLFIRKERA